MTLTLKIVLLAAIGTGVVGSSVGITYALSQPKNLKEDLEKSGIKFLNTSKEGKNDDDETWEKLAGKHEKEVAEQNNIKKIVGLEITKPAGSSVAKKPHPGIKQLKDKCEELFKKKKKDKDYSQAKEDATNWCTNKQLASVSP